MIWNRRFHVWCEVILDKAFISIFDACVCVLSGKGWLQYSIFIEWSADSCECVFDIWIVRTSEKNDRRKIKKQIIFQRKMAPNDLKE